MKEGGNKKEIQHVETNPAGGKKPTVYVVLLFIFVPWLAQTHHYAVVAS